MVVFYLDGLKVFFPYDYVYPEQYAYMKYLKKTLDSEGHCVLEMPTGTGKTVAIFSLITSYQYMKKDDSKFIFCTRTVAEMEKSLIELKKVIKYRRQMLKASRRTKRRKLNNETCTDIVEFNDIKKEEEIIKEEEEEEEDDGNILAIGISARRCMCVNENVLNHHEREKIDDACRKLTAPFVREKKYIKYKMDQIGSYSKQDERISEFIIKNRHHLDKENRVISGVINEMRDTEGDFDFDSVGLCKYFENFKTLVDPHSYEIRMDDTKRSFPFKKGVYTIEELKSLCKDDQSLSMDYQSEDEEEDEEEKKQNGEKKDLNENQKNEIQEDGNMIRERKGMKKTIGVARRRPVCPYFFAKKMIKYAKVVVLNYQYVLDPKVSKSTSLGRTFDASNSKRQLNAGENMAGIGKTMKRDIIVFDEAHNIDSVCLEALSVNINRTTLNRASGNINTLLKKIQQAKSLNEQQLREECRKVLCRIKSGLEGKSEEGDNTPNSLETPEKDRETKESLHKNKKPLDIDFDDKLNLIFEGLETEKEKIQKNVSSMNGMEEPDSNRESEDFHIEQILSLYKASKNKSEMVDSSLNEISNNIDKDEDVLIDPLLIGQAAESAIPGNIRKSENFLNLMRIVIAYLKKYINTFEATSEGPLSFLYKCEKVTKLDTSFFKYCFDRLKMLLNAMQIVDTEDFSHLNIICNFCTLIGTYFKGFVVISEPYPEATGIYDPIIQFACLDSSIAMKSVLSKYRSVVLTSATISPLELYPKLLNFKTILTTSFPMSFDRSCVCPLIVTRSSDLVPLSSQYSSRGDLNVIKNYGLLLIEVCKNIPDGVVAYFPSYIYMAQVIYQWYEMGVIASILKHKQIFFETKDIVPATIALHNFKKACDSGRGAVFLSICRGKIAEGIDFDKHYGKCVILFGIPYQYTLSKILKARLEFLKEAYNIQENEFLTFDAMRQASQCVGRIIRNKRDYGIMIFSDIRYARSDKKSKLPPWILKCMDPANTNLTISSAVNISKNFLLNMSQEYQETGQTKLGETLLHNEQQCWQTVRQVLNMEEFI